MRNTAAEAAFRPHSWWWHPRLSIWVHTYDQIAGEFKHWVNLHYGEFLDPKLDHPFLAKP